MVIYRTEELMHEDFIHDIRDTIIDVSGSDNPDYSVWHFKAFDNYEPTIADLIIYDYWE